MQKTLALPFVLTLLVILAACQSLTPSPATEGTDGFCLVAKPIIYSRLHDTPETVEQIKEHNAVGVKLCGWKGAEPVAATPSQ